MDEHRIRLPAPWQVSVLADQPETLTQIERRFNRPTGLSDTTQIVLEIDATPCAAPLTQMRCWLNGCECGMPGDASESDAAGPRARLRLEVAELQPTNTIRIRWQGESPTLPDIALVIM
ncbi:MAG: hypothetical protein IT423_17460 [Pirellulaceae bacterium]|nr:hypothetical protein [Pirellulaceae bacterium]